MHDRSPQPRMELARRKPLNEQVHRSAEHRLFC